MPYNYLDEYGATDLGLDFGPNSNEYSGESLEDFYDYLMRPRHQQRWGGSGAIKHYGPDRYASINPEDAAMADLLLKQMEAEDEREFNKGNRASMTARRQAADELMMPSGGGGGTIQPSHGFTELAGGYGGPQQVGGGMPDPSAPPAGPPPELTAGQGMVAGAGGYIEQPSEAARAQAEAYAGRSSRGATSTQISAAQRDLYMSGGKLEQAARMEDSLAGKDAEALWGMYQEDPGSVPDLLIEEIREYGARRTYLLQLAASEQGQGQGQGRERERWAPPGGG